MEKTIGAFEARRRFGQLLEEAFYKNEHFVIERSGRPMAVIVSIDDYQKWQRLAKERVFILLDEVWKRAEAESSETIEADIAQALATLRQELLEEKPASPVTSLD